MQTNEEYQKNFLSPLLTISDGNYTSAIATHLPPLSSEGPEYPDRVDWRQKGFVTPVSKNISDCDKIHCVLVFGTR